MLIGGRKKMKQPRENGFCRTRKRIEGSWLADAEYSIICTVVAR